jgi:rhomboid protease GluP
MAAVSKRFAGVFGGRAPVTTAVVILNFLMFAVSLMGTMQAGAAGGLSILFGLDSGTLYRLGALWTPSIEQGEAYRLVMAMFLHGGLIHIGFNTMVLMDVGPVVEEVYGSARFLFLYILTGISGFAVSAFTPFRHGPVLAIGASGAIMGLVGIMIAITTKRGGAAMQALRSKLVSWVVSVFVMGFILRIVDNWAHFGGLAAGFLLGKLFADREPMNPGEVKMAQTLGWVAGLVVLVSFASMVWHFKDPVP